MGRRCSAIGGICSRQDLPVHAPPRRLLPVQATYRSVDTDGNTLDRHRRRWEDVFPGQARRCTSKKTVLAGVTNVANRWRLPASCVTAAYTGILKSCAVTVWAPVRGCSRWNWSARVRRVPDFTQSSPWTPATGIVPPPGTGSGTASVIKRTLGDEKPVG